MSKFHVIYRFTAVSVIITIVIPGSPTPPEQCIHDAPAGIVEEECAINRFPWEHNLIEIPKNPAHFCGGALLKLEEGKNESDVMITAATCRLDGSASFSVVAGANVIVTDNEFLEAIKVDAEEFIVHPNYTLCEEKSASRCLKIHESPNFEQFTPAINDLAIVKLKRPIEASDMVKFVSLPKRGDGEIISIGTEGLIAGWGAFIQPRSTPADGGGKDDGDDSFSERHRALRLRGKKLKVVDSGECEKVYWRQLAADYQNLALICAGEESILEDDVEQAKLGDLGGAYVMRSTDDKNQETTSFWE